MPTRRPPAQQRRPASAGLLVGALLLGAGGLAHAGSLEQWREKAGNIRALAENNAPKAYQQAQQLLSDLPPNASAADRARALNILARSETYFGLTSPAAVHAQHALALAKQNDDRIGQVEADLNIAINSISRADIDNLSSAPAHALETLLDGADHPDLLAEASLRQAMAFYRQGQLEESVALCVRTLEIAKHHQSPFAMVYAHQCMAISYAQSKRPGEALEHFTQMREWSRKAQAQRLEAEALRGMAGEEQTLGNTANSERHLQAAITKFRDVDSPFSLAQATYLLAEQLRHRNQPAAAMRAIDETVGIYERHTKNERHANKFGLWWALIARSSIAQSLQRIPAARVDAERAQTLAKEIGLPTYLAQSAQRLAAVHAALGNYRLAYAYAARAADIDASVAHEKTGAYIVKFTERYQKESRQREIDELTRHAEQQAAQQRWLWTVLIAGMALLAATSYFLLRQRRSNRRQKQLNEQLQRSRNKLQATLDAIPDLLFELGLDGRYHDYHSPRTDLLAAPAADLLGKTVAEALPPEAAATCIAALHEAEANGTSTGRQISLTLPQGTCWFELSVARKATIAGQEPRFIVLSRDITERKRFAAQEEIRLRIFERLAQGGGLDDILANVLRYVEQERPELLCSIMLLDADGQRLRSTIGPRLPADYLAAIDGTAIGEGVGSCGTAAWRKATVVVEDIDSHPYWAPYKHLASAAGLRACWSEPILDCAGTVLGTFAIYLRQPGGPAAEDQEQVRQASHLAAIAIERIRMAAALATSEREFRTLAENMPDNVVRYDNQGRRTYLNPTMAETLGIHAKAALGKTPLEFPPEMRDTLREYAEKLRQVLATGEPAIIEMTIGKGSRQGEIHNVNIVAERDEQARIVGALAISSNITELKHKEREIAESRDLLRELAARRDSAREEERKHIAREIHDELGQMLTAQRLDIATLQFQFGKESPLLANRCQQLIKVTDQTIQVVRDIATALRPASLDMGIAAALEWLATEFRRRNGIICRLQLSTDDVDFDEEQSIAAFRIVQESLTNVARYAEARHVEIALERHPDRHRLTIRDDGKGFNPDSVSSKSFGLVGIRERALMLGGEARLSSAPGRGTAVEIDFPRPPRPAP